MRFTVLLCLLCGGLFADATVSVRLEVYELDAPSIEAVGLRAERSASIVPSDVRHQLRQRGDSPIFEVFAEGLLGRVLKVEQSERFPFRVSTVTPSGTTISTQYASASDSFHATVTAEGDRLQVGFELRLEDARPGTGSKDVPPEMSSVGLEGTCRVVPGEVWMSSFGGRTEQNIERLVVLFIQVEVVE